MRPHNDVFGRNYTFKANDSRVSKKKLDSDAIAERIEAFKEKGGKIEVLECALDIDIDPKIMMGEGGRYF